MTARTLPIRVTPIPGEALDSWLEAISVRLDTPLRTMITSLGLARRRAHTDHRGKPPDWTVCLETAEAEYLSAVTGVSIPVLSAMTLRRWHPDIIRLDLPLRSVRRSTLWGALGSRLCSQCLAGSGGRWQLTWRLSWSFACLIHRRLLVDLCPQCQRKPRTILSPLVTVPAPAHCAMPRPGATNSLVTPRCGWPLASIDTMKVSGQVLEAQHTLHQLIADPSAQQQLFPLYPPEHISTPQLMQDLKIIAAKVLNHATDIDLSPFADAGLIAGMREYLTTRGGRRPGSQPPRDAATTAIGLTVAVKILQAPDHATATERINWLLRRTCQKDPLALKDLDRWKRLISPTLHSIVATPVIKNLSAAGKLSYRATTRPARPATAQAAAHRARNLPASLWPRWALQLTPVGLRKPRNIAQALAICVLRVGTQINQRDAIALLQPTAANPRTISHLLHALTVESQGEAVMQALTRLAESIDCHEPPIDYARRRTLFGATPPRLTAKQWQAITGRSRPEEDLTHAQRWIFEHLTGSLAEAAPHPLILAEQHLASYQDFVSGLTQQDVHGLRGIGEQLLHQHHIDEPLTWSPQLPPIDGLPGPHPETIAAAQVHELQIAEHLYPHQIARRLGTTPDHIRYLQQENPVPAVRVETARLSQAEQWAIRYAQQGWTIRRIASASCISNRTVRQALLDAGISFHLQRFKFLHLSGDIIRRHQAHQSIAAISRELGIGRNTTKRILRHNGITYPDKRGLPRYEHLRAEIISRYTAQAQPIKYIARDLGIGEDTVSSYLRNAGIDIRLGANSHLNVRKGHPNETPPRGQLRDNLP